MGGFAKASSSGSSGVTAHSLLTGLVAPADDHTQYLLGLDVQEGSVSVVDARDVILDYAAADFNVVDAGGGRASIALAVTPIAGLVVEEGGASVVAAATGVNFAAADFNITDEGSNVAGIALAVTPIAGVAVEEESASVVAAATGLNFDGDDFDVTDEGSNVAGVSLASGLIGGVALLLDGSNLMDSTEEVNFAGVGIITSHRNAATLATVGDDLDDGSTDTVLWDFYNQTDVDAQFAEVSTAISGAGHWLEMRYLSDSSASITPFYRSLWQLTGDFEIWLTLTDQNVALGDSGSKSLGFYFGLAATDEADADLQTFFASGYTSANWTSVAADACAIKYSFRFFGATAEDRRQIKAVEAGAQTWISEPAVADFTPPAYRWPDGSIIRWVRSGSTMTVSVDTGGTGTNFSVVEGSGTWNNAACNVIIGGMATSGTGGLGGSYFGLNSFAVISGTVSTTSATGPTHIRDSAGNALDAGQYITELYAGARATASNLRLRTINQTDGIEFELFDDLGVSYGSIGIDSNNDLVLGTGGTTPGSHINLAPPNGVDILITADMHTGGAVDLFTIKHDQAATGITALQVQAWSGGHSLFLNPSDGGAEVLSAIMYNTGVAEIGNSAGILRFQNSSLGDIELFQGVAASANNRKIKFWGHDGSVQHEANLYHDGDWLWLSNLTSAGEGIILRSEPGVWRFQTGSSVHSSFESLADVVNLDVAVDTTGQHAVVLLGAKTTATTAAPYLAFERQSNVGTFLNLAADDNYRLSIWQNADPGNLSGTPAGFLAMITSKSGGEYTTGLIDRADFGIRTDAPLSLALNVAGQYRRIAFGVCDEYGGMYVTGGATAQTITTAGTYYKVTAWTTAYSENRRLVADPTTDDDLTVATSGVFFITVQFSFSGTGGAEVDFKLTTNGGTVDIPGAACRRVLGSSGDTGSASMCCIETLTAATPIELYVTSDDDGDQITIRNAQLILIKLSD